MTAVIMYGPGWLNLMPPLAVGAFTKALEPYASHPVIPGIGAKSVYRFEVIVPAMLPVQLAPAVKVYEAFKFIKRPEEAGMKEFV
jgi:hypothetical protein